MSIPDTETALAAKAPEIAKALGNWRVVFEHRHFVRLHHPTEADVELGVSAGYPQGNKGRVEIAGVLPWRRGNELRVSSDGVRPPRITVAIDRPADVIAAEISRRALPGYLEALAEMRRRIALAEEAQDARGKLARRLADVVGVAEVGVEGRIYLPDDVCSYGHLEVGSAGESVRIDASFSPEQAEAVLRALAGMR